MKNFKFFNILEYSKSLFLAVCTLIMMTAHARAHEVIPAVADFTQNGKQIDLEIRFVAESIIAGIDLGTVTDTNDADQSQHYDKLRALSPEALAQEFQTKWPELQSTIHLIQGQTELPIELVSFETDPIGNVEIARYSYLTLGAVATGQGPVKFSWDSRNGDIVLRQMGVENGLTQLLQNGVYSDPIQLTGLAEPQSSAQAFATYIPVGFDHILPKGLDHILFVLGLFFLTAGFRALIWQISAFTLAHTVTLAAGALGWVTVSGAIVEPLIAASIVFVAVENIMFTRLNKWRPFVIFAFGLLHGLGFASVLGEFGLPSDQFIPALIGFNVGVEFGQLTVIALAFLVVGIWFGKKTWYRKRIAIPASAVIATIGAYWFVERVFL